MIPITVAHIADTLPEFLRDADHVCVMPAHGRTAYFIGEPHTVSTVFTDGISRTSGNSFAHLFNPRSGFASRIIANAKGEEIAAPLVIDDDGTRAFSVSFGPGFKEILSTAQAHAWEIASGARSALLSGASADLKVEEVAAACAVLLACANHIDVASIAALRILDDVAMVEILKAATGVE
jgi:hypothetical protein